MHVSFLKKMDDEMRSNTKCISITVSHLFHAFLENNVCAWLSAGNLPSNSGRIPPKNQQLFIPVRDAIFRPFLSGIHR
jgi:hypothetical protein